MMRSVLLRARPRDVLLLTGQTDEVPSGSGRLPPLDAEEGPDEDSDGDDRLDDGNASLDEGMAGEPN